MKKHIFEMMMIFVIFAALAFASAAGRSKSEEALKNPGQIITQLQAETLLSKLLGYEK